MPGFCWAENRVLSAGTDSSPSAPNERELGAHGARLQLSVRRNHWPVLISHKHVSAKTRSRLPRAHSHIKQDGGWGGSGMRALPSPPLFAPHLRTMWPISSPSFVNGTWPHLLVPKAERGTGGSGAGGYLSRLPSQSGKC